MKMQKPEFTENITRLHVLVSSDTLCITTSAWPLLSNLLTNVFEAESDKSIHYSKNGEHLVQRLRFSD